MEIINDYKNFIGEMLTVPEMQNWVLDLLNKSHISQSIVSDINTALGEALSNILSHAYKSETLKPVKIKVIVDTEKAIISVRDFGRKFDIASYVPPEATKGSSAGRGIYLMRKLMDGVQYFPQEIGTELLMWKSLTDHYAVASD